MTTVSCLCITRGKYEHLKRALDCFVAQTWPEKEIVLVWQTMEPQTHDFLYRWGQGIRFVQAPPGTTLGEMRNMSVAAATGKIICCWDDDDWHAPTRIEEQVDYLTTREAAACMLRRWMMVDEVGGRAFISPRRHWEGSMVCYRDLQVFREGYAPLRQGEDTDLLRRMIRREKIVTMDRPELYAYIHHGGNTCGTPHFEELMKKGIQLDPEQTRFWLDKVRSER